MKRLLDLALKLYGNGKMVTHGLTLLALILSRLEDETGLPMPSTGDIAIAASTFWMVWGGVAKRYRKWRAETYM